MQTGYIVIICLSCLLPILIGGGFGLHKFFQNRCTTNMDCSIYEKCTDKKCVSACDGVSCGHYGRCQIHNHASVCTCHPDLYFSNTRNECVPYSNCTTEMDCGIYQQCSNKKCISACDGVSCGTFGKCHANINHVGTCGCGPKLFFENMINECASGLITRANQKLQYHLINATYIQFYVKAEKDVFIHLKPDLFENSTHVVVHISADDNTKSSIYNENTSMEMPDFRILNNKQLSGFRVSWDNGNIILSIRNSDIPIMAHHIPNIPKLRYIDMKTSGDGEWIIEGFSLEN